MAEESRRIRVKEGDMMIDIKLGDRKLLTLKMKEWAMNQEMKATSTFWIKQGKQRQNENQILP
jgi:hypothetical protein